MKSFQKMFIRKIKYNPSEGEPFVRFLNEFEAQKDLFEKEGITLESKKRDLFLINKHFSPFIPPL